MTARHLDATPSLHAYIATYHSVARTLAALADHFAALRGTAAVRAARTQIAWHRGELDRVADPAWVARSLRATAAYIEGVRAGAIAVEFGSARVNTWPLVPVQA